ncbi:probable palmitoyltransferase ZDHHC24 [Mya arenaria]|uniref:probable palmitoyltransferase ZDHHC24 n=1 Tax=Mya arenaria TaxID=6604 RepID=UPI0022DF4BBC|nr:probable palmitoyltransferase ZDHHC24 [Mya arenaria]
MKLSPPPRRVCLRLELPKTLLDALGQVVFIFGGALLLWYEVWHILPTYYSDVGDHGNKESDRQSEIRIHYAVAVFFAVNVYGNYYKIVTTDTSQKRYMFTSGSLLPDGWRHCFECNLNLPPRSHHCKICDTCILKRDHHCWFTGCCIGYFNHRYYIAMVTHCILTALYCNIFNLDFVISVKGHLTLFNLLSYIGPHFGLIFGYYGFYDFFITTMTTVGTVLFFIFCNLLYIQLKQIYYGQTKYELKKNIKSYDLGLCYSLRECMGKRWYLILLFPWIPSPLPGSGNYYRVKGD